MEIFIALLLLATTVYGFTHHEFTTIDTEIQRICGSDKWIHLDFNNNSSDKYFSQQALKQCAITLSNLPEKRLSKKIIGFLTKQNVQLIQISGGLNSIENNTFVDLNDLKYLGLSNNNLNTSEILESNGDLFSKLEWLDLSANNLHHLDFLKTRSENMKKINLDHNAFEEFPLKPLRNFRFLNQITIKRNEMRRLSNEVSHLPSVHYLDASYNILLDLHGIENFMYLKYLDLTANRIKQFDGPFFKREQYYLEEFILDGNFMKVLDTEKIVNLTHLKKLSLERNELNLILPYSGSKLKYDALLDTRLEFLNLGKNHLTDIPSSFLRCFPTLKTLKLNNNKFNHFRAGTFANLNQLESLDLSNNEITNFDERRFIPLESLLELNIEKNNIKTIDYVSLVLHVPSLRNISVSKNPLECDNLREMLTFLESTDIHLTKNLKENKCFPAEHIQGICCLDYDDVRNTSDIIEKKLNLVVSLLVNRNGSNHNSHPELIFSTPKAQQQNISIGYITKFNFWTGVILIIAVLCILLSIQVYFKQRRTNQYTLAR